MNIFKSKLLWLAPIAAILVLVIFSLAFYPAFNPKPKQLPIAVVNNDKGVDIQGNKVNIGKKIEDKLMDSDSDTVKWVKVDKESDIKKGLKDEKYYGVAIFNKDFSKNAMSKTQKVVMDSKKAEMKEKVESGEIPAFLMVVLMGVTGLVVNLFLATYGNYAIASYGISFRLVQFPELIIMGLSEGVVPLIAYNFVSNKTRMKDTIKVVIVSIAVIFAVCMTVVLVAGHSIVQLFSTDPQIVVLATFILKVTMTSLLLNGIGFLFTGMLQATGQGRGATIMAIAQGTVIIPVLFVLNSLFGLTGVIWSLLIAETVCAFLAMFIVYLLRNRLTVDKASLIEVE